jgi:hypothetical protein
MEYAHMTVLGLILTLVIVGVLLWLVNSFVTMDPKVKQLLNAAVLILLVVWLIVQFLPAGGFLNSRIGR